MTIFDLIKQIAIDRGMQLSEDTIEAIAYMETTYPWSRKEHDGEEFIVEDFREQIENFFNSGTDPGQRQDELIEKLRSVGEWPVPREPPDYTEGIWDGDI